MTVLRKWNYKTHDYDPYEIPDDWHPCVYTDDMDAIVTCPHCGKKIRYGDGYTSNEIHTSMGMGYAVCKDCYEKEMKRRMHEEH